MSYKLQFTNACTSVRKHAMDNLPHTRNSTRSVQFFFELEILAEQYARQKTRHGHTSLFAQVGEWWRAKSPKAMAWACEHELWLLLDTEDPSIAYKSGGSRAWNGVRVASMRSVKVTSLGVLQIKFRKDPEQQKLSTLSIAALQTPDVVCQALVELMTDLNSTSEEAAPHAAPQGGDEPMPAGYKAFKARLKHLRIDTDISSSMTASPPQSPALSDRLVCTAIGPLERGMALKSPRPSTNLPKPQQTTAPPSTYQTVDRAPSPLPPMAMQTPPMAPSSPPTSLAHVPSAGAAGVAAAAGAAAGVAAAAGRVKAGPPPKHATPQHHHQPAASAVVSIKPVSTSTGHGGKARPFPHQVMGNDIMGTDIMVIHAQPMVDALAMQQAPNDHSLTFTSPERTTWTITSHPTPLHPSPKRPPTPQPVAPSETPAIPITTYAHTTHITSTNPTPTPIPAPATATATAASVPTQQQQQLAVTDKAPRPQGRPSSAGAFINPLYAGGATVVVLHPTKEASKVSFATHAIPTAPKPPRAAERERVPTVAAVVPPPPIPLAPTGAPYIHVLSNAPVQQQQAQREGAHLGVDHDPQMEYVHPRTGAPMHVSADLVGRTRGPHVTQQPQHGHNMVPTGGMGPLNAGRAAMMAQRQVQQANQPQQQHPHGAQQQEQQQLRAVHDVLQSVLMQQPVPHVLGTSAPNQARTPQQEQHYRDHTNDDHVTYRQDAADHDAYHQDAQYISSPSHQYQGSHQHHNQDTHPHHQQHTHLRNPAHQQRSGIQAPPHVQGSAHVQGSRKQSGPYSAGGAVAVVHADRYSGVMSTGGGMAAPVGAGSKGGAPPHVQGSGGREVQPERWQEHAPEQRARGKAEGYGDKRVGVSPERVRGQLVGRQQAHPPQQEQLPGVRGRRPRTRMA